MFRRVPRALLRRRATTSARYSCLDHRRGPPRTNPPLTPADRGRPSRATAPAGPYKFAPQAPCAPCFARGFLLAEPPRLHGFPRRRGNPGLPPPAIYAGSAANAVIRVARRLRADPSGRQTPERQHEPNAGVARQPGAIRRTNGFHTVPGADARGFHRAVERDLRRRRGVRGNGRQGQDCCDRKGHGRHRRRPQDRGARGAQGIHQSRPRPGAWPWR